MEGVVAVFRRTGICSRARDSEPWEMSPCVSRSAASTSVLVMACHSDYRISVYIEALGSWHAEQMLAVRRVSNVEPSFFAVDAAWIWMESWNVGRLTWQFRLVLQTPAALWPELRNKST